MRGCSGSGKSSYIAKHLPDALVCSADHAFIGDDGIYRFDRRLLGKAHGACQEKFKQALKDRVPVIVIDNTNTLMREMKPYVQAAKHRGYRVECVRMDTPVDVAAARNAHGVPYGAVKAMAERMCDVPPDWNETIIKYESFA